jgi:RNA polymerase sigma factor (sigma-70 family)
MTTLEKEFVLLINTHPAILYKVCKLYCSGDEDRKDLFQEIVYQLWKAFPSFRGEAASSTWMYRIALNTAISTFRKERKKPSSESLSELTFEIPESPAAGFFQEDLQPLYEAIEALTSVEKAIILLYLDEKSYEEIAAIIGITKTHVGVKVSRIKAKLEKILKPVQN